MPLMRADPSGPQLRKDSPQILHPSRLHTALCKSAPRFRVRIIFLSTRVLLRVV